MKYTSRNPNGINQITGSAVAVTVLNNDVAVFTTSSLNLSGSLTASSAIITGNVIVQGTASINTLVVNQTQLSTGSNQLGDAVDDIQTLFGTVRIPTGSFNVTGSSIMSGSLRVTGGITGSFSGSGIISSASFATNALTASFVNPLVQNVLITGSLLVSGSTVISGSLQVTQGITGSLFGTSSFATNALTASFVNPLTQSVSISGSLLIGENSSSLYTSRTSIINSGSTALYSIPTSSYDAVYFDYVIKSGSNARAGQVFSTYITTASTYIDNSTSDIGNTSVFYFSSSISSSNLVLHGSTTSDGWKVKTIIRGL